MIEFKEIRIEGFTSIKSEVFRWDRLGLNIIQALNGSGKTKFISALSWVLFGKTLGGSVEPWDSIKDEDYRGTKVEQNLMVDNDELKIIRCKDYRKNVEGAKGKNRLIVLVNGESPNEDLSDKRDNQTYIVDRIGFSFDLFKNSIIFGQKLKRLISETGPTKKKIFDEAFEVAYIPRARKIIDNERVEWVEKISIQQPIVDRLFFQIEAKEQVIDTLQISLNNLETLKKAEIHKEESELRPLQKKRKELLDKYEELDLKIYGVKLDVVDC